MDTWTEPHGNQKEAMQGPQSVGPNSPRLNSYCMLNVQPTRTRDPPCILNMVPSFRDQPAILGGNDSTWQALIYMLGWICLAYLQGFGQHHCVCSVASVQLFVTLWTIESLPSSFVHGIREAWVLKWVAMPSSRGSSWPRKISYVSCIGNQVLYH